jgi:dihydroorotate dehydrogenase (NAD+) catalytic subunit|uniref:Dihydroorotate dehydrogenase n=1 Tax=Caldisericum exile TaxID=693075 RepID=A0A7C4U0G3_9BACT
MNTKDVSISSKFLGKNLKSPLVLVAGVLNMTASSLLRIAETGAGMVTTKSLTLKPREGHKGPVVVESEHYILNSMGIPNPGVVEGLKEVELFKENSDTPLIVSVFGTNQNEFVELAKMVNDSKGDFIELNLSCPNVLDEVTPSFTVIENMVEIVEKVKKISKKPVIVKLPPHNRIKDIAQALEKVGVDAVSLINSLPGMVIDIKFGKPFLTNRSGGISGPALKPYAVKLVYEVREVTNIPIIGIGGVLTGSDAIEMMMAGAQCVGIGSGVYYRGIEIFNKVNREIKRFMRENGYKNLGEITGKAHSFS